jgi:hypothetical protein
VRTGVVAGATFLVIAFSFPSFLLIRSLLMQESAQSGNYLSSIAMPCKWSLFSRYCIRRGD